MGRTFKKNSEFGYKATRDKNFKKSKKFKEIHKKSKDKPHKKYEVDNDGLDPYDELDEDSSFGLL